MRVISKAALNFICKCHPQNVCQRLVDHSCHGCVQVKQVSLNPLAKHPKVKAKTEEEQLETRQLENALDKICRWDANNGWHVRLAWHICACASSSNVRCMTR